MKIQNSQLSHICVLNEQIARHIFDILPSQSVLMIIMDKSGNCWPSDSEKFSSLNITELFLHELCAKIDDGAEPVVTQMADFSIIASQLFTEKTNCGYVILALPQYSPESTLINIDLIEMLLNQVNLIARLIEKNNLLYELKIKQFSEYCQTETPAN